MLKMDEVSIRCMGCSTMSDLETAIREGWKMCKNCNFAICSFCLEYLGDSNKCLSYICSSKNKNIDIIPLPIEKILIFAGENLTTSFKEGLIYKIFYKERENRQLKRFPFLSIKDKNEEEKQNDKPTKVQEEIWKNFQLVITKRKGGKFISWEKIIQQEAKIKQ